MTKKKLIWILIIIGFLAMEFPGILIIKDRVYPFIFGLPFIYGYMLICWIYMVIVMIIAYKLNWGDKICGKKKVK